MKTLLQEALVTLFGVALCFGSEVFTVDKFGGVGDGNHDDTLAFIKAWKAACSAESGSTLNVSSGKTYLVGSSLFEGPCNGTTKVKVNGKIKAPANVGAWNTSSHNLVWLQFHKVNGLEISGGGTIDGNGHNWWTCKRKNKCSAAPTALTISYGSSITIKSLYFLNSQGIHLNIHSCKGVSVRGVSIVAPGDSPNTDGIHVGLSNNVFITASTISTGDDCISIVNGSYQIKAMNVSCGPGHGISIGSLGHNGEKSIVSNIEIKSAQLTNTTNGVRIKTWQGGRGKASNIRFLDVELKDVENPIIIDQFYCNTASSGTCGKEKDAVKISNVAYENIRGSSTSKVVVKLNCSDDVPCEGLKFKNVNLVRSDGSSTKSKCNNAYGVSLSNNIPPLTCLKN